MIIESLVGRFTVTAQDETHVNVTSLSRDTIVSVLDGVELVGGAEGEDRRFTSDDITEHVLMSRRRYTATLTRAELMRYLNYEVLNFLDYHSLNEMHKASSTLDLTPESDQ
jgi:RAB protein geranylgeranyltransferase component A